MSVYELLVDAEQRAVSAAPAPWRPPSGAAEDRNDRPLPSWEEVAEWRPPSGAAEDRNIAAAAAALAVDPGGGRPPGRPRIATARPS